VGLMMVLAMLVSSRRMQSQPDLINATAWLVWLLVIAPVSHFHYHMLVLWPMTVLAFLALVNTDSLLRTLARVTLVVYLLASICTLALPRLQYVGLLCWTTTALWVVLLFVAARYKTDPEVLTIGTTVESQGRRNVTADIVESIKGIGFSLGRYFSDRMQMKTLRKIGQAVSRYLQ